MCVFFFQAEDGIRDIGVTGVQTCALPIFEQDLVQTYVSTDMVVLAIIERAHVEVGGLPAQDWALRVTLVYRRNGAEWHLAHRHADPLVSGISLEQAAALARGEAPSPDQDLQTAAAR